MEYLRGQTLEHLLRTQPAQSVNDGHQILLQICSGLEAAHRGHCPP
jgi:serine/threonine protein kinase